MSNFSKDEITKLKEVFGPLHKINIEGTSYILRTLNRKEIALLRLFDDEDISPSQEEYIVKLAIISPVDIDFDEISAGIITSLATVILDKSGVLNIDSLQDALLKARAKRTVFTEIYEIICAGFPAILPGDLDTIPLDRLMDLFVMAESILLMNNVLQEEIVFDSNLDIEKKEDVTAHMLQNALDDAKQKGHI